jgi:hypothetical protein
LLIFSRFRLKQASTLWTFGMASRQSLIASGMQAALSEADTLMASSPVAETAGANATKQRPTKSAFRKDMGSSLTKAARLDIAAREQPFR